MYAVLMDIDIDIDSLTTGKHVIVYLEVLNMSFPFSSLGVYPISKHCFNIVF